MKSIVSAIGKAGENQTVLDAMSDIYWAEQELAYQPANSDPLKTRASGADTEWLLDDEVVARTSGESHPFSEQERQGVGRYLYRQVFLHPQISRSILDQKRLPVRIETVHRQGGDSFTQVITFGKPQRTNATWPLPRNMRSELDAQGDTGTPESRGIHQVVSILVGKSPSKKDDFNVLMDQLDAAAAGNRPKDVYLLVLQISLEHARELSAGC